MDANFTGPGGRDPVAAITQAIRSALPNESDGLYVVQRERSRFLKRTGSGVDAAGRAFIAYSPKYAKRKAKYRDQGTVDLRGRNAPHMLQAMIVTSGSLRETGNSEIAVRELAIGFYDERAAMLAKLHNEGGTVRTRLGKGKGKPKKNGVASFRMPRRNFFNPEGDIPAMERDLAERVNARLRAQNT